MRRSDEEDFARFARAHHDWLVRVGSVLAGDGDAGQDLAQEALVKTYTRWRRVSSADDPRAYVRQILVRCAIDAGRRPWRREVATAPAAHDRPNPHLADHAQGLVDRDQVDAALDALPPRQRQVLVLRFVEDLDVATTARLMRVREGTVKSTTSAALAALRTRLGTPSGDGTTRNQEVTR